MKGSTRLRQALIEHRARHTHPGSWPPIPECVCHTHMNPMWQHRLGGGTQKEKYGLSAMLKIPPQVSFLAGQHLLFVAGHVLVCSRDCNLKITQWDVFSSFNN